MAIGLGIFLFSLAPGPARADNAIGMAALEAGDFKRAHALLLPEAEAGNAVAQYEIGRMYDRGRGVDFDAAAAAEWFRAAARLHYPTLSIYVLRSGGIPLFFGDARPYVSGSV